MKSILDGGVLFTLTTNEVENPGLKRVAGQGDFVDLGVVADEVAWEAILSCLIIRVSNTRRVSAINFSAELRNGLEQFRLVLLSNYL